MVITCSNESSSIRRRTRWASNCLFLVTLSGLWVLRKFTILSLLRLQSLQCRMAHIDNGRWSRYGTQYKLKLNIFFNILFKPLKVKNVMFDYWFAKLPKHKYCFCFLFLFRLIISTACVQWILLCVVWSDKPRFANQLLSLFFPWNLSH